MWRFKASKYKNANPKVPKKGEGWITDITVGNPVSFGNFIKASSAFIAFNVESGGGGSLGLLPINASGSQKYQPPLLNAHSELITDFDFCPYDDGLLATGSQDHHVKLWRIPNQGLVNSSICNPVVDLFLDHRVEVVTFHPDADCILTSTDDKYIKLWDVCTQQQLYDSSHDDVVQSISWKGDGSYLASCGKDKKLRIWDPRSPSEVMVTNNHSNNRDGRVTWFGDTNLVLTTGFGSGREREVILRDVRNLGEKLACYSGDSSLGVLIPLFDPDTNMLFLVAKADTTVAYWEIMDKAPYFSEATKFVGDVQVKGAALVPKRAMNVMEGEVNRVLLLGSDCIVPLSYQVPRKSYREFHADLFPETRAPEPAVTASQWKENENLQNTKISLDPSKLPVTSRLKFNHKLGSGRCARKISSEKYGAQPTKITSEENKESKGNPVEIFPNVKTDADVQNTIQPEALNSNIPSKPQPATKKPVLAPKPNRVSNNVLENGLEVSSPSSERRKVTATSYSSLNVSNNPSPHPSNSPRPDSSPSPRRAAHAFGMRVSKFRHLNGTVFPKETHITDISSLTRTVPGESDGFYANPERVALPLGAAGGLIGILELSNCGRAPSIADVPGVICGTSVMDFAWDPFSPCRLVTVCDTGDIQVWELPEGGVLEKVTQPSYILRGHSEKVTTVKFNPSVKDIICTASSDLSVRIWNLATSQEKYCLQQHTDQILCIGWSLSGRYVATVCKDQKVRIYDPRVSSLPIQEGTGPPGTRGARVVWVLNDTHIVVSGFSKVSERQVYLYEAKELTNILGTCGLDVSPATLVPYYDEGSSTLFLSGKGDSTIFAYEVAHDSPYFHPLSHYKCSGPHQALSFLPKSVCNVRQVEFARAVRLTTSSIEMMSFTVPRLRSEFFQDDLFRDTRVTWAPTISSEDWLSGVECLPVFISLKPSDMVPLSEAPAPEKPSNTSHGTRSSANKSDIAFEGEVVLESSLAFLQNSKEKEEMIVQSMMSQCQFEQDSLPQDSFEGVDPDEWDEEEI